MPDNRHNDNSNNNNNNNNNNNSNNNNNNNNNCNNNNNNNKYNNYNNNNIEQEPTVTITNDTLQSILDNQGPKLTNVSKSKFCLYLDELAGVGEGGRGGWGSQFG